MTQDEVNHSQVGNVFMLGAAALFSKSSVLYLITKTLFANKE